MAWEWLVWLISDEEVLIAGLKRMADQQADHLKMKRDRLSIIGEHIQSAERKIDRLLLELAEGDYDDDILRNAFRSQLDTASAEKKELETEFNRLEVELRQVEVSPDQQEVILNLARQAKKKILDGNYENKRFLLNSLNFKVIVQPDEECGKIFNVSCSLPGGSAELRSVPHEG